MSPFHSVNRVKMANRIASTGDSPSRRILVSITPATGRGMFETLPNRQSLLRNLAVAGNTIGVNLVESNKATGSGADNSGKLYAVRPHRARLLLSTLPRRLYQWVPELPHYPMSFW